MFNFIKKRINSNEAAEICIYLFADLIHSLVDKRIKDKWIELERESDVRELIPDSILDIFIRDHFKSDSFHKKYKKLSSEEIEILKMAIFRGSISMKIFIKKMIEIYEAQDLQCQVNPKMKVSWSFPDLSKYSSEFFSVKMMLIGHFAN